jgi:hypothetical protein
MTEFSVPVKIDFALLKEQKRRVAYIDVHGEVTAEDYEALQGILALIDHIQDYAVDKGIATEAEVFIDDDEPTSNY